MPDALAWTLIGLISTAFFSLVAVMNIQMTALRTDMRDSSAEFRGDIKGIRADVAEIRTDIVSIRQDIVEMRGDVTELRSGLQRVEGTLDEHVGKPPRVAHGA